ncbi:MAG TPA: ATP-dependent protease ATPase subunit HslU [Candidatus Fimadaptatus faecigallinarum]|uniref:ATP-dependent protease ATPase subunit ClpY n=1 Tax=Candidatus Fimadaptatus faecigallinarum TaxID=2840814 RepID=A0A9D1S3C3_9FIRM|nr:ATP-dependent protease ATPase subunit HslU [Candidatus Fimadaptatus faecigallinarum]
MNKLTPREIVRELDRYIIGQDEAKKAVAVALRNRYRRAMLPAEIRDEVTPKNILMMGPTGVGKTEIARRLAKLVDAPFVKVEATKFTEVGYVGRDVDSIIRDLVEAAIRVAKEKQAELVHDKAVAAAEDRLVQLIVKPQKKPTNPIDILLGTKPREPEGTPEEKQKYQTQRDEVRAKLRAGELEHQLVEVEVEEFQPKSEIPGTDVNMNDMLGQILPKKTHMRKVEVSEARRILTAEEEQNLIDMDSVYREAIERAEQDGIVFLDEIDKIAGRNSGSSSPDVSREGVQRDILPLVEGSTVSTKYGPVKTDHILFMAAGAFHVSKVSDLIPELQGRFPVRVELKPLSQEDYRRILTQPENALIRQYQALLGVDNIKLVFEEDALDKLAELAFAANETNENIGARRLHTLMESLLQEISYYADGSDAGGEPIEVRVNAEYVLKHLPEISIGKDLHKYIL